MNKKYAAKCHVTECHKTMMCSTTWSRILNVKDIAETYINWVIGEGSINFWFEGIRIVDWVRPSSDLKNLTVREALLNPAGWEQHCASHFSSREIYKMNNLVSFISDEPDQCICWDSNKGNFALSSAWQLCRKRHNILSLSSICGILLSL